MELLLRRLWLLRFVSIGLFLVAVYGPLLGVFFGSLTETWPPLAELATPRRISLLVRSLAFSAVIALAVSVTGTMAALALMRRNAALATRLQGLLLASLALPPTIAAMSSSQVFGLLAAPSGWMVGGNWFLAGMVQGIALLPFSVGMGIAALRASNPILLDAARIVATPVRQILGVTLPLAAPTLSVGATLVFLLSLLDYTIPSIFGVNVYALEIFVAFSASGRIAEVLLLSLPLAGCSLALLALLMRFPQRHAQTSEDVPAIPDGPLPVAFRGLLNGAAFLMIAAFAVLLFPIVPGLGALGTTIEGSAAELRYTLATSVTTALVAVLLALGPALELSRGGRRLRGVGILFLLPFLLPPALIGVGLIAQWSPVHSVPLYGTAFMTVAAEVARFAPVSVIVLAAWLLRIDPILHEAALVSGASLPRILTRVVLPLAAPGLAAAAGIAFVLSLGDIGATLLVTPAGQATLNLKAYNSLHYGGSQSAAGICALLLILAATGVLMTVLASRSRRARG